MDSNWLEGVQDALRRARETLSPTSERLVLILTPQTACAALRDCGLGDLEELELRLGVRIWLDLTLRPGECLIAEAGRFAKHTV